MKKILALVLSLCMVLSMGTMALAADAADPAVQEAYVEYIHEWLLAELAINSSMTIEQVEDEFMPLVEAGDYVSFPAEMLYSGMLNSGVAMTIEEFAAQYVPAEGASGEASDASGEAMSAEEAYVEYIHEWLLAEDAVNDTMTPEIVENEFMPLIEAGDYVTFPAEMLWNGMLNNGSPMTFEEFAAQYVPAAPAGGDTSEAAYQAYLKEYIDAVPAVTDDQLPEYFALIEAGDYISFPVEMAFNATWWGFAAMPLAEFVAAGGVYELHAFDPGLTAD